MEAARRLVGTLAHPLNRAAVRSRARTRHRRLRRPAAARRRRPRQRQRVDVRAGVLRARRRRSLHDGGLGRLPGPLPRGQLRRQGHLRRRRVRGGARESRARERAAEPRPVRRLVRARRAGAPTSISSTTTRRTTWPSRRASTAGRAATGRSLRWLWRTVPDAARPPVRNTLPVDRALEDLRQPAAQPAGAGAARAARRGLDDPARVGAALDACWRCWCSPSRRYVHVGASLSSRVRGVPMRQHVAAERDSLVTSAYQSLLSTTFLAHQAWLMTDAIVRTLVAPARQRADLLEWVSADRLAGAEAHTPPRWSGAMWARPSHCDRRRGAGRRRRARAPAAGAADDRAVAGLAG